MYILVYRRCLSTLLLIASLLSSQYVDVLASEVNLDAATGESKIENVVDEALVGRLLQASGAADGWGGIPEQTAIDVAAVIQGMKKDPETTLLLLRMKEQGGKGEFEQFRDGLSEDQIVSGLAEILQEMKMLEVLFEDPKRAYDEMLKEGMVPKGREKEYKKNPKKLEDDTRKSLYFTFVSLAAAGGYV